MTHPEPTRIDGAASADALLDRAPLRRWSAIRPDDVVPAVEAALERAQRDLDALLAAPTRTYATTVQAFDDLVERVQRVYGAVSHLVSVATSPELRAAQHQAQPRFQAFMASLTTHQGLWTAFQDFAALPEAASLDPLRSRHLEKTMRAFRRAGADLPEAERAAVEGLRVELARLSTTFAEHVLDATNAFELRVEDAGDLAGLPDAVVERAAADARAKGLPGWRFTLQAPSLIPFLTHGERRDLRERLWRASVHRADGGPFDNRPLIAEVLRKRRELARRLGYATFADLVLEERMVRTSERAVGFVADLAERTRPYVEAEWRALEAFARDELGLDRLEPWDVRFAFERMRRARFGFDEEALRAYLPFDRVEAGVFELVRRLFGLTVRPAAGVDAWHPSVRAFEVEAEDGTALGTFYTDWHPRESKRDGAWMNGLVSGGPRPDGGFDPHVGVVVGNLTPPRDGAPALLSPDEVRTVFHEYGHLFHQMLTRVEVRARGASAVAWDFIEVPSQIFENWTWDPEGVALYAMHHESGAPLPRDLLDRMLAARRFSEAWAQMGQLAYASVDLALHVAFEPTAETDAVAFAQATMAPFGPRPEFYRTGFLCAFSHVFAGGYAAGYYSYKWSEALEADAFGRFVAAGPFDADTGRAFMRTILERGDAEEADALFRAFMGRDPDPEALVRRNLGATPGA
jgi:oligopeptidase A